MEWLSNRHSSYNRQYSQHSRQQSSWLGRVVWFVFLFVFLSFGFSSYSSSILNASLPVTSGLKLHLDASVSDSVIKDGSNKVSEWRDLSGNGNHLIQSNSSDQPTYDGSNIDFSTNDFIQSINNIDITGGHSTIFIVSKYESGQPTTFTPLFSIEHSVNKGVYHGVYLKNTSLTG